MRLLRASGPMTLLRPAVVALLVSGCVPFLASSGGTSSGGATMVSPGLAALDAFWANLQRQCGRAFAGGLVLEPPGDEMLTGEEELIAHFRECGDYEMKIAFHIEREGEDWDRSRTWVLRRYEDVLELRHDHRRPDGSEGELTWYGGFTRSPGTATRQEFVFEERRARDGSLLGWRIEILPGERYTYGTIRGEEWTWRVDFDLEQAVPAPPPPWGHHETDG